MGNARVEIHVGVARRCFTASGGISNEREFIEKIRARAAGMTVSSGVRARFNERPAPQLH